MDIRPIVKNTKKHAAGDVVYVQQYCWPAGVCKYIVQGIKTETGRPDVYMLINANAEQITRSAWAYEVFDNPDDAFSYQYREEFQRVEDQPPRVPVQVIVAGQTGSGKTAIIRAINEALVELGFNDITVDWGADGRPTRTAEQHQRALDSIAQRGTPIAIKEMQLQRDGKTPTGWRQL